MRAVKVLIADDEVWDCEALETMIRRCFPSAELCQSVYDGIALVEAVEREQPDIVIADISMPGLNGLEALELLRSKHVQMEIVIHTAYSQFDYIHKAMRLGACDFLVKPVFEKNFVETFSRVLKGVEEKKKLDARRPGMGEATMNAVLENNCMMSLLLHKPDESSWRLLQGERQGEGVLGAFQISLGKAEDAVYLSLASAIRRHCECFSILHQTTCYCYLLTGQTRDPIQEWIRGWLPKEIQRLEVKYDIELHAGISQYREKFSKMIGTVEEAEIALQNGGERKLSFYQGEKLWLAENLFAGRVGELAGQMKERKPEQAAEKIKEILTLYGRGETIEFATCFYAEELLVNIALFLDMDKRRTGMFWTLQERMKRMIQENFWDRGEEVGGIGRHSTVSSRTFLAYLTREVRQLEEDLERPLRNPGTYIERALLYMGQNYMRDELSLGMTAEVIGITQFYLSRLFKQERNQTFLEILTDIRISKAIHLLMDPSRTIQNVSAMVGYNVKYFYQVFKSSTGISAREFREGIFCLSCREKV